MKIEFEKWHGAGNDFVMIDARRVASLPTRDQIATLANRPDGVGCEGVIFVQDATAADFRMRFFNPDGGEAEMCGNGARCVAAFALGIGAAKSSRMRFETIAGVVAAEVLDDERVCIGLPDPKELAGDFVNTGVPHFVVPVEDIEGADVAGEGRRLRYAERFAPAGTNVDFVRYAPPHEAHIRTYERGVEAESFACGTGAVAAAVVGVSGHGLEFPVRVITRRGCELTIGGARRTDGTFEGITLTGPVRRIFKGEIEI